MPVFPNTSFLPVKNNVALEIIPKAGKIKT
jgi:hypothetical protein